MSIAISVIRADAEPGHVADVEPSTPAVAVVADEIRSVAGGFYLDAQAFYVRVVEPNYTLFGFGPAHVELSESLALR
jgi:hypothetical protein